MCTVVFYGCTFDVLLRLYCIVLLSGRCWAVRLTANSKICAGKIAHQIKGGCKMLEAIAIILLILWLLGLVTSYTMGGLIHILLVIAIVVIVVRVIQGRRI